MIYYATNLAHPMIKASWIGFLSMLLGEEEEFQFTSCNRQKKHLPNSPLTRECVPAIERC